MSLYEVQTPIDKDERALLAVAGGVLSCSPDQVVRDAISTTAASPVLPEQHWPEDDATTETVRFIIGPGDKTTLEALADRLSVPPVAALRYSLRYLGTSVLQVVA